MIFTFKVFFDYINHSIKEVEALDVEQAYQIIYEEYPDAVIECVKISDNEKI